MRKTAPNFYTLSGWHTQSDIPLTGIPTSVRSGTTVDVVIQIAAGHSPIAKNASRVVLEHSLEHSLIRIEPDVADFEVSRGTQIRVWPAAGAREKDIEIFLFGQAWATLCHQRGMLPLHASAILTKHGITAFAGHSGAGKSATAALMGSLGFELVTDDVLPIGFNKNSVPGAWPYLRRLKLRGDSIMQLALTPTGPVSETLDSQKYFVFPKNPSPDKWTRLDRLYLLEIDPTVSDLSIDQITGAEATRTLIDQTYHFPFVRGSRRFREHLLFCTQLASNIVIYRLRRSPSYMTGGALARLICAHLERTRTTKSFSETGALPR
jgi:hypothetical protein